MRILIAVLLIATTASANDVTWRSMQSGSTTTPIHDRGIHGEGQIVAVLGAAAVAWWIGRGTPGRDSRRETQRSGAGARDG